MARILGLLVWLFVTGVCVFTTCAWDPDEAVLLGILTGVVAFVILFATPELDPAIALKQMSWRQVWFSLICASFVFVSNTEVTKRVARFFPAFVFYFGFAVMNQRWRFGRK